MKGNANLLKLQEDRVMRVKPSARNVIQLIDPKKSPKLDEGKKSQKGFLLHPDSAFRKSSFKSIKVEMSQALCNKNVDIQQSSEQRCSVSAVSAEQGLDRKVIHVKSYERCQDEVI